MTIKKIKTRKWEPKCRAEKFAHKNDARKKTRERQLREALKQQ
jgi:hypothetical protein